MSSLSPARSPQPLEALPDRLQPQTRGPRMAAPDLCADCAEARQRYERWGMSHCARCHAELSDSEREQFNHGGSGLCDLCSDRDYYLSDRGQRELREERLEREAKEAKQRAQAAEGKLAQIDEEAVVRLKGRALSAEAQRDQLLEEQRQDQARLAELTAELEDLRAAYPVQPGHRSRTSPLSE